MVHNVILLLKYIFKKTAKMKDDGAGMKSAFSSGDPIFDTGRISVCLTTL
jgi:hypothetical protein